METVTLTQFDAQVKCRGKEGKEFYESGAARMQYELRTMALFARTPSDPAKEDPKA
jgi:hypothetical protein